MLYGMPRKPKPSPDDPAQSRRFIDMAREVEAETPSPDFERVFHKVVEQPKGAPPKPLDRRSRRSMKPRLPPEISPRGRQSRDAS
jgi:hypothetical protein